MLTICCFFKQPRVPMWQRNAATATHIIVLNPKWRYGMSRTCPALQQTLENLYHGKNPDAELPLLVMASEEGGKLYFAEGTSKMEKLHSIDQAISNMLTYREALEKCD